MTHSASIILRFTLMALVGFSACDNSAPREVPSGAARGMVPAEFDTRPPDRTAEAQPVAAWVNGTEIHESAVDAEFTELRRRSFETRRPFDEETERQWRKRIAHHLIDEALLDAWLDKSAVEISENDVDDAMSRRVVEVFGSEQALEHHLARIGVSKAQYREKLKRELALKRALGTQVDPNKADEQALGQMYEEVANRPPHVREARLSSVVLKSRDVPFDASQLATEAAFHDLASEHGATEPVELGWVEWDALDGALRQELEAAKHSAAVAVETPVSREVFWVHEVRERPTADFEELKPVLKERLESSRFAAKRQEKLDELREAADIRFPTPDDSQP